MIGLGSGVSAAMLRAPLAGALEPLEVTLNGAGELVIPPAASGIYTHEIAGDQPWLNGVYPLDIATLRTAPVVLAVAPLWGSWVVGELVGCTGGFALPVQGAGAITYTVRLNRGAPGDHIATRVILAEASGPVDATLPPEAAGQVIWASVIASDDRGASLELHGDPVAVPSAGDVFTDDFAAPEGQELTSRTLGALGSWEAFNDSPSTPPVIQGGVLALLANASNRRFYRLAAASYADGLISVDLNRGTDGAGSFALLCRIIGDEFFALTVSLSGQEIICRRYNGPNIVEVGARQAIDFSPSTWHGFAADLTGETLTPIWNGVPLAPYTVDTLAGAGAWGLSHYRAGGASLRNLRLEFS